MAYCKTDIETGVEIYVGIDTSKSIFDDYKTAKYHKLTDFIVGEVFRKNAQSLGWTPAHLTNRKVINKLIAGIRDTYTNALTASANQNEKSPYWDMSNEAYEDIEDIILPQFEQFIGHYFRFNSIVNNVQAAIDEGTLDLTGTQNDSSVEDDAMGSLDEAEDSKGAKFERPGNDVSAIDMASRMTKLIFRLIPKSVWNAETETVELFKDKDGLPTTADFGPIFNLLLDKIAGTKNYEDLIASLTTTETLETIPEAQYVAEILKVNKPGNQRTRAEYNLLNEFYQQFSKPKIQVQTAARLRNNVFTVVDEIGGNTYAIKEQFTSNFQMQNVPDSMAQYIKEDDLQGVYLDNTKVIPFPATFNEQLDFLGLLGIKFSRTSFPGSEAKTDAFEDMVDRTVRRLHESVVKRIKNGEIIRSPIEQLRSSFKKDNIEIAAPEKTSLDELIAFESKYSTVTPSLSTKTANGELAWLISLDNQLSIVTYHLNNSNSLEDLMKTSVFRTAKYNPLFKKSFIIQFLFDEKTGKKRLDPQGRKRTVSLDNLSGYKKQSDEISISTLERELSPKVKFIQDYNMMLTNGKTDVIRPEVSNSFFAVSLKNYDETNRFYFGTDTFLTNFQSNNAFKTVIHGYLTAEIQRVKSYEDKKKQNSNLPASYGQFSIFYETLEQNNTALRDELLTSGQIDKDSPLFNKFMENYEIQLNKEVEKIRTEINLLGINDEELYSDTLKKTINKSIEKNEVLSDEHKDALLRAFVANTTVQNIEFATLYGIDPLYTTQFHKRLKGISSTGDLAAVHSLFTEFRKSPYENMFHEKYSISGAMDVAYRNNDKNFQTKTLKEYKQAADKGFAYTDDQIIDDIIASVTKRDGSSGIFTRNYIINEVLRKRESQNPADGQGYISLDFHRELSLRHGYNNDNIEAAYKYEGLIYRRDIQGKTLSADEASELADLEALIYKNPNKYAIPVLKFTYWGGIENSTIDTKALDKLSVYPLRPSDVRNKGNEKLKKLLDDMAEKQIGYVKYETGTKLYTTEPVNIESVAQVNADEYSTELLKMQIRPKTTQNDSTAIPTQLLKLIFSNLFSQGKPVTERAGQLYKSYIETLKKIQGIQGSTLLEELGITDEGVDMKVLSERLIKQAKKQELNSNVINALQVVDGDISHGVLEESGFVKQIIDLVSGLADSRLRRWEMPGGDFVLVSNANRSKLNFYKYDANGTIAADVRITLNGEFVKLLKATHPDGKPIGTIERLNALLENEKWRQTNKKLITVAMGRVPIQGPNSMEFGIVKEFLTPTAGNVIILPEEIVFKAGLDFDYDKEKVLTPSFTKDGRYIEDVAGVQAEIDKLKLERKGIKTEFYKSKNPSETMVKMRAEVASLRNILEQGNFDSIVAKIKDKKNKKKFDEGVEKLKNIFTQIANLEIAKDSLTDLVDTIDEYADYETPVNKFPFVPDARFEGYIANEAEQLRDEIENATNLFEEEIRKVKDDAVFNIINEGYGFRDKILSLVQFQGKELQENYNNMVTLYAETLALPEMFAELVTPNSTKTIDTIVKGLTDLNGKTLQVPTHNQVFNYLDNLHIKDILFAAKNMLSPFAVDNTYMQVMQYLGVNIISEYKRKWGKNEDGTPKYVDRKVNHLLLDSSEIEKIQDGKVIKSSLRDDLDNYVKQHYDSEAINITVDAAKDPRFALLNIDKNNVGVLNFMKNMGYPFGRVVSFLNQPILLKYLEYRKNGDSKIDAIHKIGKILGINEYKTKSTLVPEKTYKMYKNNPLITITKEVKQKDGRYSVSYLDVKTPSVWNMMKVLRNIDNQEEIPYKYRSVKEAVTYKSSITSQLETRILDEDVTADDFNLRIFAHFIAMDEHNAVFRNFHYYFNNDRVKTSTPTDLKTKDDLRETLLKQHMFSVADIKRAEDDSIFSAFMNNDLLKKVYKAILPVIGREDVQATFDKLYRGYATNFNARNSRDLRNMPKVLTSDFITAVLFNFNVEDGKTFLQRNKHLLIYNGKQRTISKRLDALRKQPFYTKLAKQFPVLDQLVISDHKVKALNDLNGIPQGAIIKNIKLVKPSSETSIEEESTIDQLRSLMTYKIKDRKFSKEDRAIYNEALHKFVIDLFNVGLIQSGVDKTQIGFSEYIPTEYKRSLFAPALRRFEGLTQSSPATFANFLAKFESQFRYNNPKFFPSVKDPNFEGTIKNNNDYSYRFKQYDAALSYVLDEADEDLGEEDASKTEPEVTDTLPIIKGGLLEKNYAKLQQYVHSNYPIGKKIKYESKKGVIDEGRINSILNDENGKYTAFDIEGETIPFNKVVEVPTISLGQFKEHIQKTVREVAGLPDFELPTTSKLTDITEITKDTKKEKYTITKVGNEKEEVEGYRIYIKEYPNFRGYVRKRGDEWTTDEFTTGMALGAEGKTAKKAIENLMTKLNQAIKAGGTRNEDVFKKIGIVQIQPDNLPPIDTDPSCGL